MNSSRNIYFQARKEASKYDNRLSSRELAADLLGVAPATLADYELGNVKVVPVDKVVLMSDLYNRPELKNWYCKNECPIGKDFPLATEQKGLEGIALRLVSSFDGAEELKKEIIDIAKDGKISRDEVEILDRITKQLDQLSETISEMKIFAEKVRGTK